MKNAAIIASSLLITSFSYAGDNNSVKNIQTNNAPLPVSAYSQATSVNLSKGKLLYVSGQIAQDPKTGKMLESDIHTATRQVLDNIEAILKAAGSDWKYVASVEVYLKDFKDWEGMNEEYVKRFPNKVYPARHSIQVGMNNRVEISCVALIPTKS
jgi:2-iminobutanoate/2-iminopropanoate deaminase